MTAFALSIIGLAAISILIEILLPEGETAKYIKGVFSILTVFIIVLGISNLIKDAEFEFTLDTENQTIKYDSQVLEGLAYNKYLSMQEKCEEKLASIGYENCEVTIVYDISVEPVIKNVKIRTDKTALNDKLTNTNIKEIKEIIAIMTGVSKEVIEVD